MMMSKPRPEASAASETKSSQPADAVSSLEKRLAQLGGVGDSAPAMAPPAAAPAAAGVTATKNPLLARIMAAQERAKQAQTAPPPAVAAQKKDPFDFLSGGAPQALTQAEAPPPSFDAFAASAPPAATAPPPAFDAAELPSPDLMDAPPAFETVENTTALPPPAAEAPPAFFAPPAPSAPAFDDLMDVPSQQQSAASAFQGMEFLPPPTEAPPMEAPPMEMDFTGLEGLSEEEKNAMIEEQRQIMAQIQKSKADNKASEAVARAEAFEQRSASAAAAVISSLDGPSTGNRSLAEAAMSAEDAQMEADRKMAEQLQNEEYKAAARSRETEEARRTAAEANQSQSWMEWLGLSSSSSATRPERPIPQPPRPVQRGEMGVARPPGAGVASSPPTARTGEETITFTPSYEERQGLIGNRSPQSSGGARVAEQKPLFSCVADSISMAATSVSTALAPTLQEDAEGNVHGVDASSLLAVTQVGRERDPRD